MLESVRNAGKCEKYSLAKFEDFVYNSVLREEIVTTYGPKIYAKFKKNLQGYIHIFRTLRHLTTKLSCNFTNYTMFFLAVVLIHFFNRFQFSVC